MPSRTSSRKPTRRSNRLSGPSLLVFLLIIAIYLVYQAWQENRSPNQPSPGLPPGQAATVSFPGSGQSNGDNTGAIAVFFSDPLSEQKTGGPENQLVAAIAGAKKSVDVAIYNISLKNVADAIIAAHNRGVTVRMVMESEAMDNTQPTRLLDAGIPIVGDQREGLMHNKFTVIDGSQVWGGSMNYTNTSAYNDFNNLIRLDSQRAAQDYTVEFEEMFIDNLFGANDRPDTPYPQVDIDGVPVGIYFSPDDGVTQEIVAQINRARKSINFMVYSFTSDDIARAIRERAAAGVAVRGVFDESQVESNLGGEYEAFKADGFDVRLDGISGLLHHKVIIIDGQVVITGSFNFSVSAERTNDENTMIIHSPSLAAQYQEKFETVYLNGK